jgi:hypothetical protein
VRLLKSYDLDVMQRCFDIGRLPKLTPHHRQEAIKRRDQGEEALADIGRSDNISSNDFEACRSGGSVRTGCLTITPTQ